MHAAISPQMENNRAAREDKNRPVNRRRIEGGFATDYQQENSEFLFDEDETEYFDERLTPESTGEYIFGHIYVVRSVQGGFTEEYEEAFTSEEKNNHLIAFAALCVYCMFPHEFMWTDLYADTLIIVLRQVSGVYGIDPAREEDMIRIINDYMNVTHMAMQAGQDLTAAVAHRAAERTGMVEALHLYYIEMIPYFFQWVAGPLLTRIKEQAASGVINLKPSAPAQ